MLRHTKPEFYIVQCGGVCVAIFSQSLLKKLISVIVGGGRPIIQLDGSDMMQPKSRLYYNNDITVICLSNSMLKRTNYAFDNQRQFNLFLFCF